MTEKATPYGRLIVGEEPELFQRAIDLAAEQKKARATGATFTWALTGGSTPQAWYNWCVQKRALPAALAESVHFTVSDERHVAIESDQNNFGNAQRLLLKPLGIDPQRCHAWNTAAEPKATVDSYRAEWKQLVGADWAYDVCFLGMGEDAHTASFFPGSPLLEKDGGELFDCVDAGERGLRFTITPSGLQKCGLIVVMTLGESKATALKRVMTEAYHPRETPAQILRNCAERTMWLVDGEAAGGLAAI